ncbi:hypothetical protein [Ottowia testudinis]|uniref:Uncharacterized protein n=1 Tax=Ottowia testudinis TaxID=2816950 RepID=A0A975H2C4_9BURK|nr:hypothetical protein [Ottowia testudinis]QTD44025.1 hypothetical protein J1M35_12855 [Ottowia testudinis]
MALNKYQVPRRKTGHQCPGRRLQGDHPSAARFFSGLFFLGLRQRAVTVASTQVRAELGHGPDGGATARQRLVGHRRHYPGYFTVPLFLRDVSLLKHRFDGQSNLDLAKTPDIQRILLQGALNVATMK